MAAPGLPARGLAHINASTSQPRARTPQTLHTASARASGRRGAPAAAPRAPPRDGRRGPPPPRITNIQKEWLDKPDLIADELDFIHDNDDKDAPRLFVQPEMPEYDAHLGPLTERVSEREVEKEVLTKEFNMMDTAYWFHTPPTPEGWNRQTVLQTAPQLDGEWPQPWHNEEEEEGEEGEEGGWRFPFAALEAGLVAEGVVSDLWLHFGLQVDFGCEMDGLIPMEEEQWRELRETMMPGRVVKVKVHAVRDPSLHMWPVQLEVLDEDLRDKVTPPEAAVFGVDVGRLFDEGMSLDEVTDYLRRPRVEPVRVMLEPDMSGVAEHRQWEYGWRESDIRGYGDDFVSREVDEAAQRQINEAMAREAERG